MLALSYRETSDELYYAAQYAMDYGEDLAFQTLRVKPLKTLTVL